jgi:hypothetical protein
MYKFNSFRGSKWSRGGPWTLTIEARGLKMVEEVVCRQVVTDSQQFDEE